MKWEYGGIYKAYDMTGVIALPGGSLVEVCDWTARLPEFMKQADTLFVDPPWNMGNARTFYTKAELPHPEFDFLEFSRRLFERIDQIAPRTLFIEMGKQYLGWYLQACSARYSHLTFYNSTYFHKQQNKCYVIHASQKRERYKSLEDLDEEDIIKWICANHGYECIGDLCMGRGLVGKHAYLNGRRFVGTELNKKRLAVLVNFILATQITSA
ncbi:MAG: hypothetical protein HY231_23655 [Acidobacteria bacterium]|nr:hypothetical protein [Acidobacteriota bacterium]